MEYTFLVKNILGALTIFGQVLSVALLALLLTRAFARLVTWISTHGLTLMLIVALTAMLGSLFFSDIAGWAPCKLCWYQRILMYPQVFLLALALWKRDRTIAPYILLLSAIGILISVEHYREQVLHALFPPVMDPNIPCDSSGVSCVANPNFTFGYITLPLMAFTAFTLNAIAAWIVMKKPTV
jgi:disulfide bond formation protein DsbB